ncbi:MAG: polymer-forming cytoskeletal protein [Polyangiaceae bacterium]
MASNDHLTELGAGTLLRGRLTGQGNVKVNGHVIGNVELGGELVVATQGTVQSESLSVAELRVEGVVEADTLAARVEVLDEGTLRGRVQSTTLVIHPGAHVTAMIEMAFELPEGLR